MNATWQVPPIQTLLRSKYTPSSQQHYPTAVAPQQDNVPKHTVNTAPELLEEHNRGPKVLTRPPIPQIPIRSSIGKMCWSISDPLRPDPPTYRTQRIHYKMPWCQTPQDFLRCLKSMSWQVRAVLNALCLKFSYTLLAKHYSLFFYIRHIVRKGNHMQSLRKHIYLKSKTRWMIFYFLQNCQTTCTGWKADYVQWWKGGLHSQHCFGK